MGASLGGKVGLYWHTVRRLKPVQVYGRFFASLNRLAPAMAPQDVRLRGGWSSSLTPFLDPEVTTDGKTFTFLNQTVTFEGPIDWCPTNQSPLWRYNLHYFEYLASLPPGLGFDLIEDWIARNQDRRGEGWNPYPLSLRIIHWFKWIMRHGESALSSRMLRSLYSQAAYLSRNIEFHIQANHLFENAKSLFWAGLSFEGAEADAWLRRGKALLLRELDEQILADGGHYERSPMYHALILEGCLDLLNLAPQLERHAPDLLELIRSKVTAMTRWLQAMCHPDGEIALFNDAAFGIAPAPVRLLDYAERLGVETEQLPSCVNLQSSGYVVRRSVTEGLCLIMDVGEIGPAHQPGHAHCDTLSFELSLNGSRVFVDSGVFSYQDPLMRAKNRGTAAHNTVRVDRREQSEIWGAFRVARRAEPRNLSVSGADEELQVQAEHTGYDRLGVRHRRSFRLEPGRLWITDRFDGGNEHLLEVYFHLHPELSVELQGDRLASLRHGDREVAQLNVLVGPKLHLEPGEYCPRFGVRLPQSLLRLEARDQLPLEFTYCVSWPCATS